MLPSHSPRNRAQKRNNPFGRKTSPVARSGSLLGTIKNIVTAPLTWFANGDDFEDGKGKRRRAAKPTSATDGSDEELVRSRVKRMRLDSPDRQVSSGYLDPPEAILPAPTSIPRYPYQYNQASKPGRSHSSLHPPNQRQLHHSRTLSPYPTSYSQSNEVHRTMSMDPPSRQPVPRDSYGPSHLRRETSMDSAMHRSSSLSIPRDFSASPTRSGFRMRTSVTPQPSGSSFGPTLQRRPRDPSEPPPLTSLVSNPIFVKPPPEARQRQMSVQPTITLGSLMDSERAHLPV
ncbi:hypothetical protein JAAARDRAFT_554639 [Jaapia argillacea MUCL 33604]|uniref:Uncharacterized protein n=1 Tax=Jaapia argillacea MUCL 33604 TaxID=933084 RepID=A0A067QAR3_9AGAM|nr:hypothetical protein JAAARDRAFT_554639 [Jaapia argillacea MUCL 33604]